MSDGRDLNRQCLNIPVIERKHELIRLEAGRIVAAEGLSKGRNQRCFLIQVSKPTRNDRSPGANERHAG